MSVVDRPDVGFDADSHTYTLEGWDPRHVHSPSTVAKIGQALEAFSIGSAWGFRIGYEGTFDLLEDAGTNPWHGGGKDALRADLKGRKLTPWDTRDKAAERGTWIHDVLEALATDGQIPHGEDWTDEVRGHVRGVMRWYLDFRPLFVATEVQVGSRTHGFAGRYDLRLLVPGEKFRALAEAQGVEDLLPAWPYDVERDLYLVLGDYKSSKDVYPLTHFAQLEGYEIAGVEMGYPATDARAVLQTQPDGSYKFVISWGKPTQFLAFLGALRAIREVEEDNPAEKIRKREDEALLAALPGTSRALAARGVVPGLNARSIGLRLGGMRKRGLVRQLPDKAWERTDD